MERLTQNIYIFAHLAFTLTPSLHLKKNNMHKNNIHGQTVMRIWSCFAVCKIKIIYIFGWILFMTFSTDIYDFSIQKSPLIPAYDVLSDSFTLSFDLLTVYKFPWEQLVSPTPIIACASSVLLSSYRNMSFNQSACIFS